MTQVIPETVLREESTYWALPVVGREVDQVCVDFAVTLVIDGSHCVRLAGPFVVHVGGVNHEVDPAELETLAPVLSLFQATVTAAQAGKDGTLELRFNDDRWLRVQPQLDDEVWEVSGGLPPVTESYRLTALPGGGVAVLKTPH
jgi:hypothetical protein